MIGELRLLGLHQRAATGGTQKQGDEITDRLKDRSNCLVHNLNVLNGELLGLFRGQNHLSYTLQRYKKILRLPNIVQGFSRLFHIKRDVETGWLPHPCLSL